MCMLEPPIEGPTFVGKWTNFVCGWGGGLSFANRL